VEVDASMLARLASFRLARAARIRARQMVDGASHYDAGNPEPRVIPARDANACERARGAAHLNARDDLSGELRGTRGEPPFLF
jgi:hypothetical protein